MTERTSTTTTSKFGATTRQATEGWQYPGRLLGATPSERYWSLMDKVYG